MLKRLPVKYIRDRCKSAYAKDSACKICGSTSGLEFHHYNSMTAMLDRWLRKKKITIVEVDDILGCRDDFISDHYEEIYNKTVTLCKSCHARLHKVYGVKPSLGTATKQERWVLKQREKNGLD